MPNYSEVISDYQILEIIKEKKARDVLVLGCDGCMNESLAWIRHKPIMEYKSKVPYKAIFDECKRICDLLQENGIIARFEVIGRTNNVLCIRNIGKDFYAQANENEPDLVMVMSCPAGFLGLKECLYGIDIVSIAKCKGVFLYIYSDNSEKKEIQTAEIILYK